MDSQQTRRALVIDDDTRVRNTLQEIMTSFGYSAATAASGGEGISLFDKGRYNVVLTDLMMPDMTGWEVLAAVRALDPEIPVIIVTGAPVCTDDRHIALPPVAFVTKPVDMEILEAALSSVLRAAKPSAGRG
ncbi:MAG: response regulator [Candidatus Rokubacteria bacterium]|nr:response regulator [Candidatus Rokubacteria bacterium]